MLNIAAKVLIGVGVAAVTAVVIAVVTSKKTNKQIEDGAEKKVSLIQGIKEKVTKKAVRVLAWVAVHTEQIEAVSTVVGLVTGVFGIISAVKEYRRGDDANKQLQEMQEQINYIKDDLDHFWYVYDANIDKTFHQNKLIAQKLGVISSEEEVA